MSRIAPRSQTGECRCEEWYTVQICTAIARLLRSLTQQHQAINSSDDTCQRTRNAGAVESGQAIHHAEHVLKLAPDLELTVNGRMVQEKAVPHRSQ